MKTIVLILAFCVVPFLAFAETQPPEPAQAAAIALADFANGRYLVNNNMMIVLPDQPMLKQRIGRYGDVIDDPKTGQRMFNTKNKGILTAKGKEVYELLTRLTTKEGFFFFSVVVIEYDRVTLSKYQRSDFDDQLKTILKAFE